MNGNGIWRGTVLWDEAGCAREKADEAMILRAAASRIGLFSR